MRRREHSGTSDPQYRGTVLVQVHRERWCVRRLVSIPHAHTPPPGYVSTLRYRCPMHRAQQPATTAAADPPLDPPGTREVSHGLAVAPKCGFFVVTPKANSCRLVLPRMIAPASLSLETSAASNCSDSCRKEV